MNSWLAGVLSSPFIESEAENCLVAEMFYGCGHIQIIGADGQAKPIHGVAPTDHQRHSRLIPGGMSVVSVGFSKTGLIYVVQHFNM